MYESEVRRALVVDISRGVGANQP
eukprot:SAG22_NODE_11899_length_464_cov_0.986301_1_plen_23_part_10